MTNTVSNQTKPRAVLITGAGTGIGASTALLFAQKGYQVILVGRRANVLEEMKKSLPNSSSKEHLCFSCDLSKPTDIKNLASTLKSKSIRIHALVNNAGIFKRNKGADLNGDLWREIFTTNLFGSAEITENLLPLMPDNSGAAIINVSSGLGARPVAGTGVYSASKAAMDSWTKTLAIELGPRGIRVCAVAPGLVDTPIHEFHSLEAAEKTKTLDSMSGLQPLGRIGTPDKIAEAICFLASKDSDWTTGAILTVDGGINLV